MTTPETVTVKRSRLDYPYVYARRTHIRWGHDVTAKIPNSDKPGLDIISMQNPYRHWETNTLGIGRAVRIDGYCVKPKENPYEALGSLRFGFGKLGVIPIKEAPTGDIPNFIVGEAHITGETFLSGNRNLIAGKAFVSNSTLKGGCYITDEARVESSDVRESEIHDSAHVVNSELKRVLICDNAKLNNVQANRTRIYTNIEIDASALPDGRLEVYKPVWDEWLIPGNRCGETTLDQITRHDIARNLHTFEIQDGDVFSYLPHIRACFDPENHRSQVEQCHCLIWLPLILSFSPVALNYLMRVTPKTRVVTGRDKNFLKDVRERVRDTSFNNPLSSVSLRDLEAMLVQEHKEYAERVHVGWRLPHYLKMLGVTDEELKRYRGMSSRCELVREDYVHLFQHVTGIRLGDMRPSSTI